MLSKRKSVLKYTKGIPGWFGATTLGLDAHNDVQRTKNCFYEFGLKDNFTTKTVSKRYDHDIFTYLRQPGYKDFLKLFIKSQQ